MTVQPKKFEIRSFSTASCRFHSSSIKYIYCTDTLLDNTDADTREITKQSLEKLESPSNRNTHVQTPNKDLSRQTSGKQSPMRMEMEGKQHH